MCVPTGMDFGFELSKHFHILIYCLEYENSCKHVQPIQISDEIKSIKNINSHQTQRAFNQKHGQYETINKAE